MSSKMNKKETKKVKDETPPVKAVKETKKEVKKPVAKKPEPVKESSESEEPEEESDDEGDDEGDESDEGVDNESDSEVLPVIEKKKETFSDLLTKLEDSRLSMKKKQKEINELKLQIKSKEKEYNDFERQCNSILKLLTKSHSDEVNKARKEKPKRKGNVNGGFNKEHPVPEVLISFLGLAENACMSRPKVMSALNNKFTQLGLKNGQNTTLDKSTVKALKLNKEEDGRVIKFTEFQSFLASFYPKKVIDVSL
jgi:hypothetical protein